MQIWKLITPKQRCGVTFSCALDSDSQVVDLLLVSLCFSWWFQVKPWASQVVPKTLPMEQQDSDKMHQGRAGGKQTFPSPLCPTGSQRRVTWLSCAADTGWGSVLASPFCEVYTEPHVPRWSSVSPQDPPESAAVVGGCNVSGVVSPADTGCPCSEDGPWLPRDTDSGNVPSEWPAAQGGSDAMQPHACSARFLRANTPLPVINKAAEPFFNY